LAFSGGIDHKFPYIDLNKYLERRKSEFYARYNQGYNQS
jgi:hypothetical protein